MNEDLDDIVLYEEEEDKPTPKIVKVRGYSSSSDNVVVLDLPTFKLQQTMDDYVKSIATDSIVKADMESRLWIELIKWVDEKTIELGQRIDVNHLYSIEFSSITRDPIRLERTIYAVLKPDKPQLKLFKDSAEPKPKKVAERRTVHERCMRDLYGTYPFFKPMPDGKGK